MQDYVNGDIDQGPQTLRIGWAYRPNSGNGEAIQIINPCGPGYYDVRAAHGGGPSWTMRGEDITEKYTLDPDGQVF